MVVCVERYNALTHTHTHALLCFFVSRNLTGRSRKRPIKPAGRPSPRRRDESRQFTGPRSQPRMREILRDVKWEMEERPVFLARFLCSPFNLASRNIGKEPIPQSVARRGEETRRGKENKRRGEKRERVGGFVRLRASRMTILPVRS